eukprot:TRINITY_DN16511_c0_g1_i1.p1 TRINITY_DN16511_c0_g1~~TRINITY_DN16511_c0_g1_i1.p1  ORF type:complete len:300 (-),score=90.62 TRINITY_DN16511_c0_g1_i1:18-851(-)
MVLWLVGLGLGDEKDITVKGLEAVKGSSAIYLEAYTSLLGVDKEKLEAFYGKPIIIADREFVENECYQMLEKAKESDVSFLVVGDPFGATTHSDLVLRAKEKGITVKVVHNASIMNAIGCCGLQLYRFGQTVSLVFFTETWRPDSFYERIKSNRDAKLHTLCLLDIKVKEPTLESLARGKKVYEPPRFMTVNQAIEQLLEIEEKRKEGAYSADTLCIGVARVGQDTQKIVSGTMKELLEIDFGAPLHSFVICGDLHCVEEEMFNMYRVENSQSTTSQ